MPTFQFTMSVRIEADSQSEAQAKAIAFTRQVEDSTGNLTFMDTVPLRIKGGREAMDEIRDKFFTEAPPQ